MLDLSHAHEIRFAALRAMEQLAERSGSTLPWVAETPTPGLSVRRCLERVA